MNNYIKLFIFPLIIFLISPCKDIKAQATKIRGLIIDSNTKEALPFVNISFKGTSIGTTTDFDGNYFLETRQAGDSISISSIGYIQQTIPIKKGEFQTININLYSQTIDLSEIIITPGENPAHTLLKKVIKRKRINNPDRYASFQYESYTKMELDINNFKNSFKSKKLLKKFQFIFNYVDTSVVTGKAYLPVLISESISDYYYQKNPKKEKEVIKASKVSGVDSNESIAQFTGQLHQNINVYDNYIDLFDIGFHSPIADGGLRTYKYYLIDSAFREKKWCYHITFKPKRKEVPAFTGDFWVADSTYAIESIKMRINKDVNINWVQDLVSETKFRQINDSIWFPDNKSLFIDFMLTKNDSTKQMGFFGRKNIAYRKVILNQPIKEKVLKLDNDVVVEEAALVRDNDYWNNSRPYKLSSRESKIYEMVDSIQNVPIYKNIVDVIKTFVTGYYIKGKFEYGPYYKLISSNEIEGNRFMFGGRTTEEFNENLRINAHLAYGTKDKKLKYGLGALYMLNKQKRETVEVQYRHDIEQLGKGPNTITEGNMLASLLKRNPNNKLTMATEASFMYEKTWKQGFSNKISFRHKIITPSSYIQFNGAGDNADKTFKNIKTSEIELNTRWTKNERFIRGNFNRASLGSEYPIVNLYLTVGLKGVLKSDYEYYKIELNVKQRIKIPPLGNFDYSFSLGKIYNKVPYPLLHLHEGNETYAFDNYAFNMMNYYEFASDQYSSLLLEHHFNGFFLNRVPLFKKLKWRSVISGKGLIGSLSKKNNGNIADTKSEMFFPVGMQDVSKPYFEAGVGIENIFRFIRIDAMWRLSHLEEKKDQKFEKFGIRAMLQFKF